MRRFFAFLLLVALCVILSTRPVNGQAAQQKPGAPVKMQAVSSAAPNAQIDLPVRKVVLYKNGVGYFEHAGTVTGNQHVAIDFTSSQLNDVLQSLTVLDENGGHIAGINYNSTTPLAEQLNSLSLGLKDLPPTIAVYQALRGQRVEVTGAGAPLAGRLVNVEFRKETDKDGATSEDHYFLIVETDSGALRTAELTDSVSVRMLDASLQKQFASYLEIVASAENQEARRLTLDALGQGQRQLQVSYISAVPVWKSTYRLVFPQVDKGSATMQGWAVVDNTVGADWDNVQLSLVAGAPQSFIQPLSQPIYTQRPQIAIATARQTTPQTHEAGQATESVQVQSVNGGALSVEAAAAQKALRNPLGSSFGVAGMEGMSGSAGGLGSGSGGGFTAGQLGNAGGGVYRVSDTLQPGDVSSTAFDDYFEYAITQPVTIHKNESAMVPILEQDLPAERVTLWSEKQKVPLRAVWLENKSKLTLDSGSFSIFENGEFAGEGLLDPIHPNEKRLLSYAADQAVKVSNDGIAVTRILHHISMHQGLMVESSTQTYESTYTAFNNADEPRTVVVEHSRRPGAALDSDSKPAETTPTAYRFRVAVEPHKSASLHVIEQAHSDERISFNPNNDWTAFLVTTTKYSPVLEEKLKPLMDAATAVRDLKTKITALQDKQKALAADEGRDRDNITALKGNEAAKRFVDDLGHTEDEIAAARKDQADLEKQRDAAQAHLASIISALSFDTDLEVKM